MMNPSAFMAAAHPGIPPPTPSFIPPNVQTAAASSVINGVDTPGSVNELVSVLNNCNSNTTSNLFAPNHQTSSFLQCSPSGHNLPGSRDVFSGLHNPMAPSPGSLPPTFNQSRQPSGSSATDTLFDFSIMPSIDYHRNAIGDLYSSNPIAGTNSAVRNTTSSLTDLGSGLSGSVISPTSGSRSLMNVGGTPTSGYPHFSPIKTQSLTSMVSGSQLEANHSPADRFGLFDPSGYFYPQYNLKPTDLKTPNMYSPYSSMMTDKFSYYQPPTFYPQGYESFESAAAFAYASAAKPSGLGYNTNKVKDDLNLDPNAISPFLTPNAQNNSGSKSSKSKNNKNSSGLSSTKSQNENSSSGSGLDTGSNSGLITSKELTEGEVDTRDLAQRITAELKRYSIPQAVFAEKVLGRSQGTLSDLLRNPKPWTKLKSGRETFRKMEKWLDEPEFQRMQSLRVAACKKKELEATTLGMPNHHPGGGGGGGMNKPCHQQNLPSVPHHPSQPQQPQQQQQQQHHPKKNRLVFTDVQRRTLFAIFRETKRPSKEMQITISRQLGLEQSTVSNFFMNARRRCGDRWKDQDHHVIGQNSKPIRSKHSLNNEKNKSLMSITPLHASIA